MFQVISNALVPLLRARGFDRHVARIWVYESLCSVADFSYRGTRFAFNITPTAGGSVSLDILRRPSRSGPQVAALRAGKEPLAIDVPLDQALELLLARTAQVLAAVDAQLDATADPTGPGAFAAGGKPVLDGTGTPAAGMKVGVLTLPLNTNYGGNLQAYALMEVLRQLGHAPVLLNRRHPSQALPGEGAVSVDGAETPLLSSSIAMGKPTRNAAFIEKHVTPISRVFSASSDLGRNIGRYDFDAIIVGSDQVWRPKYARGILSDFFLGFVPEDDDKVRRISYAPSFGASDWEFDAGQTAVAKRLIQRFTAVSVREDSGVALCRDHLGVEAQHVLDPTLLLTPEHYARLFDFRQRKSSGDRLLTYILDGNDDKARVTDAIAARLSLRPFSTSGQPSGPADAPGGPGGDKTVEGWLAAFHDAAFVVTDSFHGVAFSILFNKPFIAYGNPGRGLARFTSLLKMFGLEDRLVVSSKDVDLDGVVQPVDWSTVNDRLSRLRGDSLRFLTSALTGASPGLARPFAAPAAEADAAPRRRPGHPEGQATFEVSSVALHRAPLTTTAARKAPSELKNATTLALKDNERFVNSYAQGVGAARARLMFAAHAIEKGLSHLNFRAGFGKSPVEKLAKEMEDWLAEGHPADDQFFKAAASALHVYFERHKELNFDVSRFWGLFSTRVQDLILAADDSHGGVLEAASVREAEVEDFRSRSFLDVIYGRRSIREFASDPVRDEDIQRAVRIAQQSPSVCNRQAPRVHLFKDRDAIQSAITLQRGFSGYKMPPRLLLVTSDLTAFLSPTERNQAYIDGGLFMMSLLLGLEQQGLGSCCLNTAMSADRENAIREVLKIPETEIFIAFIAVGHFDRAILTPRSIRLPVEEVLVTYD